MKIAYLCIIVLFKVWERHLAEKNNPYNVEPKNLMIKPAVVVNLKPMGEVK